MLRNQVEGGTVFSEGTFKELDTETSESVFVGDHNSRDISCFDGVQKGEKTFAFEVEP